MCLPNSFFFTVHFKMDGADIRIFRFSILIRKPLITFITLTYAQCMPKQWIYFRIHLNYLILITKKYLARVRDDTVRRDVYIPTDGRFLHLIEFDSLFFFIH